MELNSLMNDNESFQQLSIVGHITLHRGIESEGYQFKLGH